MANIEFLKAAGGSANVLGSAFGAVKDVASSPAIANLTGPQALVIVAAIYGTVALFAIANGKDIEIDPATNRIAAKTPCEHERSG